MKTRRTIIKQGVLGERSGCYAPPEGWWDIRQGAYGFGDHPGAILVEIGASAYTAVGGTRNIADGAWHHVVVERDGSGVVTLTIDGTLDGSSSGTSENIAPTVPFGVDNSPCINSGDSTIPLGSLPAAMLSPDALSQELTALGAQTSRPYNVNFFCHTPPVRDARREEAWRERLREYRVAIEHEEAWPRGGHSLYFRDPAGNSVELITPGLWGLPDPIVDILAHHRNPSMFEGRDSELRLQIAIVHAADLFANGGPLLATGLHTEGFRRGADSPFDWDFMDSAGLTGNLSTWQQANSAGTHEFANA